MADGSITLTSAVGEDGVVFCKVCGSVVPKKKNYCPSICEACKKFFTRTCKRDEATKLICQTGNHQCVIDGRNRRFCTSCRYAKCVAVGMRCRSWKNRSKNDREEMSGSDEDPAENEHSDIVSAKQSGNAEEMSSNNESNSTNPGENEANSGITTVSLIQDPIVFDGNLAEDTIRAVNRAITDLHGLEFMPLRRFNGPVDNMMTFWGLTLRQLFESSALGFKYGRHLIEPEGVSEAEMNVLISEFLPAMGIIYYMLPGSDSRFIGVNDRYMPQFFSYFPGYLEADASMRKLGEAVARWDPSFPEFAIFTAFALFKRAKSNSEKINRIRRRLLLIFNLYLTHSAGATRTFQAQCSFKECYRLLECSILHLRQGIAIMASQLADLVQSNVLCQELLLADPIMSKAAELFPRRDVEH